MASLQLARWDPEIEVAPDRFAVRHVAGTVSEEGS